MIAISMLMFFFFDQMSQQTETNPTPKMKLAVLMVLVLLVAVNGAPNVDHEYQESLGNQLDDYETSHTETTNNLEGLGDTYTESGKHEEDEWTENNHHEYEEDGGSAHRDDAEEETDNVAHEDGRTEEDANKEEDGSKSSEESSEEDQDKKRKHWFRRHHKQKHYSTDGEKGDSATKKVSDKVHKMVRAQVLKKASTMAGSDVKEDEGGALAKKVGSVVRDGMIRKVAPQLLAKPLHGAVNFLKNHYDTMDNEKRGTLATRDVDTFYERALARDLGFRVADRVINTVSTVVGGALAAGTIHKLHKKSHDDVNHVVDELGVEKLAELVEELNEEQDKTVYTANQVRSLHSKKEEYKKKKEHEQKEEHEKKGHFWSKSKHAKEEVEKKNKHHKKDAHEKKDKHHLWSLKKKHNKEVSDEDEDDDDDEREQENQHPLTHHID